ncbi:hypothetical protein ABH935_005265 [Catenulispora sp. GAS73]|uniref:BBE domain-containing protein n=1 Tax=Catenulispora sp. GAS73 TaxID=3156269 RepID=UPI0035199B4C
MRSNNGLSRRGLLGRAGTVAAGSVALVGGVAGTADAAANTDSTTNTNTNADANAGPATTAEFGPARITPTDIRYDSMLRGDNFRFVGHPDEVRVVTGTEDVVRENFTADPALEVLLDLSPMNAVGYDPAMRAFSIQPGARLGEIYTTLFKGWAVTLPASGGYGPLSRRYGSVVDHLHAVEVVVVDEDRRVRVVRATREPDDPHRDLWWAHAGNRRMGLRCLQDPRRVHHHPPQLRPVARAAQRARRHRHRHRPVRHPRNRQRPQRRLHPRGPGRRRPAERRGPGHRTPRRDLRRPRRPGVEHLRRPLVRALLQGQLSKLQQIKAAWDPGNVFRHAMSVELPA